MVARWAGLMTVPGCVAAAAEAAAGAVGGLVDAVGTGGADMGTYQVGKMRGAGGLASIRTAWNYLAFAGATTGWTGRDGGGLFAA